MIEVALTNQTGQHVPAERLESAARLVLVGEGVSRADLSVAVVDDATIQRLNRQFLQHDFATDVLSFLLESGPARWEGEVILGGETAARTARQLAVPAEDELLLYLVHGVLHLVGYDDQDPLSRRRMRQRERHYLRQLGVEPRFQEEPGRQPPRSANEHSAAEGEPL